MDMLDLYSIADLPLARVARFLPDPMVRWAQLQISRRALKKLSVPPEWLAEGPDGFQAEDELDIVFGFGNPNPARVGCYSDTELIELAKRRPPIGHPVYEHMGYCSPCYRRLRALHRLKGR